MKNLSLLLTLFLLVIWSVNNHAQTFAKQGVIELGGTVGFSSETDVSDGETADESTTSFSFSPQIGYFVINGLELALMPVYSTESLGDNSSSMFGIFFMPQYHFDLQSSVYPFIGGFVGYNSINFDRNGTETTLSGLSFGGGAGVKVQIGNSALLNVGLRYLIITANPEDWEGDRNGQNQLGIEAGFSIFLGK